MSNEPLIVNTEATIGSNNYIATTLTDVEAQLNMDIKDHMVGDTNYGKPYGKQSVLDENNEYKGVINYNSKGERHGLLSLCDQTGKINREAQYENGKPVSYNIVLDGVHYSWNKNDTNYPYRIFDGKNELRYNVDSKNRGHGNALLNGNQIVLKNGKITKNSICSFMVMLLLMIAGVAMFVVSML